MGNTRYVPDHRRYIVAVKLNAEERKALERLTAAERLPAAQVVRRLIWRAAQGGAVDGEAAHGEGMGHA